MSAIQNDDAPDTSLVTWKTEKNVKLPVATTLTSTMLDTSLFNCSPCALILSYVSLLRTLDDHCSVWARSCSRSGSLAAMSSLSWCVWATSSPKLTFRMVILSVLCVCVGRVACVARRQTSRCNSSCRASRSLFRLNNRNIFVVFYLDSIRLLSRHIHTARTILFLFSNRLCIYFGQCALHHLSELPN